MSHQDTGEQLCRHDERMDDDDPKFSSGCNRRQPGSGLRDVSRRLPYRVERRFSPASIPSIDHSELEWSFDQTVDDPADIDVGDTVTFEKTLSEEDVRAFARISGDTNRLHLTTSSPVRLGSASASLTARSFPGSSAPPSPGFPASRSTSHRTSSSAPRRYRRPRLRTRRDRRVPRERTVPSRDHGSKRRRRRTGDRRRSRRPDRRPPGVTGSRRACFGPMIRITVAMYR